MKRAEAIWHFDGVYTDVTATLGDGSSSLSLEPGDKVYVGCPDWMSGLLLVMGSSSGTEAVIETFDGRTDTWRTLPVQEAKDQLGIGSASDSTGFNFDKSGMAYWGTSPYMWQTKKASTTWPETATPPQAVEYFWVRIRNAGATAVTLNRVIPAMYNTYATVEDVRDFLGVGPIDEIRNPTASFIRHRIRAYEDWLDAYTRRSWRIRSVFNEMHDLNIHGIRLNHRPILLVSEVAMWRGQSFDLLLEGRQKDYWIANPTGFIYFTFPSFRLSAYSTQLSRYVSQNEAVKVDYVYGEDFDIARDRDVVSDIILKKVGGELVRQNSFTSWLGSQGTGSMSPEEKQRQWREEAEEAADMLRATLII